MYFSHPFLLSAVVEAQVPFRLKEDDVITMGTTELQVHIANFDDAEVTDE